jgi:hypothetical protein
MSHARAGGWASSTTPSKSALAALTQPEAALFAMLSTPSGSMVVDLRTTGPSGGPSVGGTCGVDDAQHVDPLRFGEPVEPGTGLAP